MTDDKVAQLLDWTDRQLKEVGPEAVLEALQTNPAFINLTDDERKDFLGLLALRAEHQEEQAEAYTATAAQAKRMGKLFKRYPKAKSMADLPPEEVERVMNS